VEIYLHFPNTPLWRGNLSKRYVFNEGQLLPLGYLYHGKNINIRKLVHDESMRGTVFGNVFTTVSRPDLGPTQPPIQWVPGTLSMWVKRPGREADHSPPSSDEVKNEWSSTSTPPYAFMACCSVKSTGTTLPLTVTCHRL